MNQDEAGPFAQRYEFLEAAWDEYQSYIADSEHDPPELAPRLSEAIPLYGDNQSGKNPHLCILRNRDAEVFAVFHAERADPPAGPVNMVWHHWILPKGLATPQTRRLIGMDTNQVLSAVAPQLKKSISEAIVGIELFHRLAAEAGSKPGLKHLDWKRLPIAIDELTHAMNRVKGYMGYFEDVMRVRADDGD